MSYGMQTSFVPRTSWVPAAARKQVVAAERDDKEEKVTCERVLRAVRSRTTPVSCREICIELDSQRRYVERRLLQLTTAGLLVCTRGPSSTRNQNVNLYKAVQNDHQ